MSFIVLNSSQISTDSIDENQSPHTSTVATTLTNSNAQTTSANINASTSQSSSQQHQIITIDDAAKELLTFWAKAKDDIRKQTFDLKSNALPLARIKKIMKMDEEVKMISAEAPVIFAKAAELFIQELTLRAWIYTVDSKRRTLQKNDIAMACSKDDMFDFLIDIVPREETMPLDNKPDSKDKSNVPGSTINSDQVQYYFQVAQQQTDDNGQSVFHTSDVKQLTDNSNISTAAVVHAPVGVPQILQQLNHVPMVHNGPQLIRVQAPNGQQLLVPATPVQTQIIQVTSPSN